ncbi:hypothetical protein [Parvularcula sp. LCG005]|uniref:hypothetical protein n=1 Tax=Parvularcula sp. LCG005 TaxID=3078805 RepID=UPI002942194B|nr:hypothetical protein [Parvularcula sp. LCG005]WOI54559.1 hypothetical protein RUI03_06065 [Parvularcula sp. LCG005]
MVEPVQKTVVSLRFSGVKLNREKVIALFPGHENLAPPLVDGRSPVRPSLHRRLEAVSPGNLDHQISMLIDDSVEDETLWREATSGLKVDVFCGLFLDDSNEGISISPKTMEKLAKRSIQLSLDIYGPIVPDGLLEGAK